MWRKRSILILPTLAAIIAPFIGCVVSKTPVHPIQTPPPMPTARDFQSVIVPNPPATSNMLAALAVCFDTNGMTDFSRTNVVALIREHCPPPPPQFMHLKYRVTDSVPHIVQSSADMIHWHDEWLVPTNVGWTVELKDPQPMVGQKWYRVVTDSTSTLFQ